MLLVLRERGRALLRGLFGPEKVWASSMHVSKYREEVSTPGRQDGHSASSSYLERQPHLCATRFFRYTGWAGHD